VRAEAAARRDPRASQLALLRDLAGEGAKTSFGAAVGLPKVFSAPTGGELYERFSALEVNGYPAIRPYVMRMVEGEADVLWPGVCRRFAQSSGTSDGKSKFIPITPRGLRLSHYAGAAYSVASYLACHEDSHVFGGRNLILGGSYANELTLSAGVRVGDLSATLIDRINPVVNLFRIPSKKTALMADWGEKLPALVEASLKADVRSISGVPSWFLTVLKQVIERAGARTIHDVWPNLEVFYHGGIAFGPYREQYRRITDPSKMRYWENYNASEGFFAVQERPGEPEMGLLLNADTFYELLPQDGGSAPIPLWKAEPGLVAELVVTTSNGLWRYRTGDTVRVESVSPLTITIAGRTKCFINAFGEEVMVYNTDAALEKACAATGADALNYSAAPVYAGDRTRGCHQWLVEFARRPASLDEFAAVLDSELQKENSGYQAKRAG
ncbi:MAG: GH3 auxin-responsive promoter family protein, partial [Muribaculaceae bacterium]|nr:GH3 auxin-responsive promoter family protein [Muribaculaceae bacterium]